MIPWALIINTHTNVLAELFFKEVIIWHFFLFVHILFVTGILNGNNVFIDAISIIPLASMCHVEMFPSVKCGLATTQCLLNLPPYSG
jgi:hypothetical protein